jgi:imidazoleglycerol phosphate dehydratase HisB
MSARIATVERQTEETQITLRLDLDGTGASQVSTGIGFLDHMFEALAKHARFDLELSCTGDLHVSDHHTAEDCALALGTALEEALGEKRGIQRFGWAFAPLDEALARAVVDLSGRPFADVRIPLQRPMLGTLASENVTHVLQSLAMASHSTLHVAMISGRNDHHMAEAAFKATALALRRAVRLDGGDEVPSTKGTL